MTQRRLTYAMRWGLTVGVLVLGAIALAAQERPSNPEENGAIAGVVIRAGTAEPVADAWVTLYLLNPAPRPTPNAHVRTDEGGRFSFPGVMPGIYSVDVQKDGYFGERVWVNGTFPAVSASHNLTVNPRDRIENITIAMTPGGSIAGKLIDENGEPAAGAWASLVRRAYDDHGRPLHEELPIESARAQADDRGEYRMFGIPPGEYLLEARFLEWERDPRDLTFYPNVREERLAESLRVRPGGALSGVNLTVFLSPPTAGVVISGQLGGALPKSTGPLQRIILVKRDGREPVSKTYNNEASPKTRGRFEIRRVPPGVYDIFPEATDDADRLYTGHVTLVVGERDIANLLIPVQPGVTIRGRILFNGQPPPPEWIQPREWQGPWEPNSLVLESSSVPEVFFNEYRSPRTGNPLAGEFAISNVPAGFYTLRNLWGFPDDSYLEDVRLNGKSILDGFEVGTEPVGPVELLVRIPAAKVYGTVRGSAGPDVNPKTVVLVPVAPQRPDVSLYRTTKTDDNGNFALEGIRPGTYRVFAWDSIPRNAWLNTEYMEQFASQGELVTLVEGEEIGVKLRSLTQ